MKKNILKIEKSFKNKLILKDFFEIEEGVYKWNKIGNLEYIITFGCFYISSEKLYNCSSNFNITSEIFNDYLKDYKGDNIVGLYDNELNKFSFLNGNLLDFLQLNYDSNFYPKGIYFRFSLSEIENKFDFVVGFLFDEYFNKSFLKLCEKFSNIKKMEDIINNEILELGFVKKDNFTWCDYDNQCIRSVLLADITKNARINEIIKICNKTMSEEKFKNPKNPRISLYNFILEKIGHNKI